MLNDVDGGNFGWGHKYGLKKLPILFKNIHPLSQIFTKSYKFRENVLGRAAEK